jgi:hypothetical protein
MWVYYVIPADTAATAITAATKSRATVFSATLITGDPTGKVTAYPSVAVASTQIAPAIFPDTAGQATAGAVKAAATKAAAAEAAQVTALAKAKSTLASAISQLAPGLAQAQTDAATCAASTDPLAPILGRVVSDLAAAASALGDVLVVLDLVQPATVPNV